MRVETYNNRSILASTVPTDRVYQVINDMGSWAEKKWATLIYVAYGAVLDCRKDMLCANLRYFYYSIMRLNIDSNRF